MAADAVTLSAEVRKILFLPTKALLLLALVDSPIAAQVPDSTAAALRVKYLAAVSAAEAEGARSARDSADGGARRQCTVVRGQVMHSGQFESRGWRTTPLYGMVAMASSHGGRTVRSPPIR